MDLVPFDRAYRDTKRFLAGVNPPGPPYEALVAWIRSQNEATQVLNAVYDTWVKRPRLAVVFERQSDVASFIEASGSTDAAQRRIKAQFEAILTQQRNSKVITDGLVVELVAFASAARIEANHAVTSQEISDFTFRLHEPSIWLVRPWWSHLQVFFLTEDQCEAAKISGAGQRVAKAYEELVKQHDEYGYVSEEPIELMYDSRERFERDYRGSWQAYDRG